MEKFVRFWVIYWIFSFFSFCYHLLCFDFCFCFISWFCIGIASSAVGLKVFVTTGSIKKYKSMISKKKKKHDKIVLLAKTKSITIEVLISKALIDLNISHDEFILVIGVLKECSNMNEELDNYDRWLWCPQNKVN